MARRAISSKSPRPCRQRSIVCWPTRWCAGSLPRNRTPSFPRSYGRPWCSTSGRGTDGRGDCPLSRQPPVTGRVATARRIGDELGVWRRRIASRTSTDKGRVSRPHWGVAASSECGQPPRSARSGQTVAAAGRRQCALSRCSHDRHHFFKAVIRGRGGKWLGRVDSCRWACARMVTHHTAREANPASCADYQCWHQARVAATETP